jgi:copper chaperone CopZ
MAPVELKMNVHCSSCVKKIKLAVKDLRGTYTSL